MFIIIGGIGVVICIYDIISVICGCASHGNSNHMDDDFDSMHRFMDQQRRDMETQQRTIDQFQHDNDHFNNMF